MKAVEHKGITFVQPQSQVDRLLLEVARRKGEVDAGWEHRRPERVPKGRVPPPTG